MLSHRLRIFVEVCNQRSMTKAAATLFISQSVISRHMKTLEDELGTKLLVFFRSEGIREMRLTSHGQILLDCCKAVLMEEESMLNKFEKCENKLPTIPQPIKKHPLCDIPMYINNKILNHLIEGKEKTRTERTKIYEKLREDDSVRKKVYISGKRKFFYYHADDVKRSMLL